MTNAADPRTLLVPSQPGTPRGSPKRPGPKALKPFNTGDIKVLLLEDINECAGQLLAGAGYQRAHFPAPTQRLLTSAFPRRLFRSTRFLRCRSKTRLTESILRHAKHLLAIGCFCIGTNQVDLNYATQHG
ncbi:MAG: hypothetical protein BJ554DRAFT_2198, partial [Olpidium bornovanus]